MNQHSTAARAPTQAEIALERAYLLREARRRLRDRALAEDVVHDALLAALQSTGGFAGRSSLRTWLTSILHHRIADALRREHRCGGRGSGVATPPPDDDGAAGSVPTAAIDPRDPPRLLESRQTVSQLDAALRRLPPLAMQVLVLRKVEGFSTDETAMRLRLDPQRVSAILHRASQRLRRWLADAATSSAHAVVAGSLRRAAPGA